MKVNHINANGNSMLCSFNSPYSIIGDLEFITQSPIINNVIAYEDCICATISLSKYHEILMNDVFFMKTIAKNLASKLSKSTQNQSISLNYPVENRLAAYFVVSHKNSIVQDNFVVVAELIGCSYRQLQRILQLFLDQKYIKKTKRGTYQIIDLNEDDYGDGPIVFLEGYLAILGAGNEDDYVEHLVNAIKGEKLNEAADIETFYYLKDGKVQNS